MAFTANRPPDLWYVVVSIAALVAFFALVVGVLLFHVNSPRGVHQQRSAALERMTAAYDAGRYAEALRIYEAPLEVALFYDHSLASLRPNHAIRRMLADSHRRLGRPEVARAIYLDMLGWSEDQYLAFCALDGGCDGLDALQRAAHRVR